MAERKRCGRHNRYLRDSDGKCAKCVEEFDAVLYRIYDDGYRAGAESRDTALKLANQITAQIVRDIAGILGMKPLSSAAEVIARVAVVQKERESLHRPTKPAEKGACRLCGHPKANHHPANGCLTEPFICACRGDK